MKQDSLEYIQKSITKQDLDVSELKCMDALTMLVSEFYRLLAFLLTH